MQKKSTNRSIVESHMCSSEVHPHCNKLQHTATHCNTLQHTATHYNTLQHTATHQIFSRLLQILVHYNTLQQTATDCNRLQHTRDSRDSSKVHPFVFGVSKNDTPKISILNLIGLFSTEHGKRDRKNLIID